MSSSKPKSEMDKEAYAKLKAERKAAEHALEKEKHAYGKMYAPDTVNEMVGGDELEQEWFKEGEWGPGWGLVEFDGDACLKNVTKKGKAKDGFFAPAGTMLPLGAAIPGATVLKYGGYFPPGTSFPGGVMVPMHARMVNLLPEETTEASGLSAESLCLVQ